MQTPPNQLPSDEPKTTDAQPSAGDAPAAAPPADPGDRLPIGAIAHAWDGMSAGPMNQVERAIVAAYSEPETPGAPRLDGDGRLRLAYVADGGCVQLEGDEALAALPGMLERTDVFAWIDVCGATPVLVGQIARILGLHPLLAEDIAERDQRAKLEQVEELLHLVLFSLAFDEGQIHNREIDFVLSERFLLSSHSRWWDPLASRHIRMGLRELLRRGPDYLLWALSDDVVDAYFPILDRLGDEIDDLEDQVVGKADRETLERLFTLKRELIEVRRVTAPEREMFNNLSTRDDPTIRAAHALYFRDTYDHLIRVTDELDTYRELVSATVDAYLSTVNNNLSFIMKRLTAITLILAGVGAIGGLFGMSEAQYAFRLDEGPGFWIVLFGSVAIAAVTTWILRRMDWI